MFNTWPQYSTYLLQNLPWTASKQSTYPLTSLIITLKVFQSESLHITVSLMEYSSKYKSVHFCVKCFVINHIMDIVLCKSYVLIFSLSDTKYLCYNSHARFASSHSSVHVITNPASESPKDGVHLPEWGVPLHLYVLHDSMYTYSVYKMCTCYLLNQQQVNHNTSKAISFAFLLSQSVSE